MCNCSHETIRMSRFFVDASNVGEKTIIINDQKDIRHIAKVLRLSKGQIIDVSDSAQWEYKVKIMEITDEMVEGSIIDKQTFAREPDIQVSLFQGIPKQSKMEVIIQKCVEMGVYEVVPVFTERTVVTDKGNFQKKLMRWQKISDEAVKQCKRGIIPQIEKERSFDEMIKNLDAFELVLFPYENEQRTTMKDCLRSLSQKPGNVAIIIGPEGGFSDKEAGRLKDMGAQCVTLGKTILRTETAGMAALSMVMYELTL